MTPRFWSHFHLMNIVIWTAMMPIVLLTGLKHSVPFLVFISLLALVYSEFGSWQASMSERRADTTDSYGDTDG